MVTNQYYMLGTLEDGNKCFRFSSLRGFINKYLSEFQVAQSSVECRHTSSTNYIRVLKNFVFSLTLQFLKLFVIFFVKLALIFFQGHKLLHLHELTFFKMFDLLVQ